jgi:hypothetical protein
VIGDAIRMCRGRSVPTRETARGAGKLRYRSDPVEIHPEKGGVRRRMNVELLADNNALAPEVALNHPRVRFVRKGMCLPGAFNSATSGQNTHDAAGVE